MKNFVRINKTALLEASNYGWDFYYFVIPSLIKYNDETCENTYNPFYEDKKPSFSVYYCTRFERWMFKDHGNAPDNKDYSGDVFEFAKLYYESNGLDLGFGAIMAKMAEDLAIDSAIVEDKITGNSNDHYQSYSKEQEWHNAWAIGFDFLSDEGGTSVDDALTYFSQFGITKEVLLLYHVKAVKKYLYIDKAGTLQRRVSGSKLIIAYEDAYFSKMYTPEPKAFWYVGKKPQDYIFGFNQILNRNRREKNYERHILIITGGEKDVLTLTSLGYDAVSFNSETATIPELATEILFQWYKQIIIMYDNDTTGIKRSNEIAERFKAEFNIKVFTWPEDLKDSEVKDISEYMAIGADVKYIKEAIETCGIETICKTAMEVEVGEVQTFIKPSSPTIESDIPLIPEQVHTNLPGFLKHLCDQFEDRRDKDLLLMSVLGVTSSFFPSVHGRYDGTSVGLNLFLFVTAPSASGKQVMKWSRRLGSKVQSFLKQKYRSELEAYMEAKANPDAIAPERPQQQTMFIPANCSISKIIQLMGANVNFGVIMETEADTLAAAFKNDWGNFSDVLRKVFHHEAVSLARRGNDEFIEIEEPHLSVVLSGTNNQVTNLLEGIENGLFSRFLFYDFRPKGGWKDKFGNQDNKVDLIFEEAAAKILTWWENQYSSNKTQIVLQPHQKVKINGYFEMKLEQLSMELGDPIEASVKRFCLICYRIAMLLTTFRTLETANWLTGSLTVEDKDFECALNIVDTLLIHLQRVYTRLENASQTNKLKAQPRTLYEDLPEDFTREQYNSIANGLKIKFKTAERYLSIIIKQGLLERYGQGKYRKL